MIFNTYQKIGMKELIDLFECKPIKPEYFSDSGNEEDMIWHHKYNKDGNKPAYYENGKNVRNLILFYEKINRDASNDGNFLRAKNYLVNHNLVDNEKSKEIIKTPEYVEEGNEQSEEQKIISNEELLVDQLEEELQLNNKKPLELSEESVEKELISTEDVSNHYKTKNDNLSALGEVDNDSELEQNQEITSSDFGDKKVESLDFECKDSSVDEKDICFSTEIISVKDLSNENNEPEDVDKIEDQSAKVMNLCIGELNTREKDVQDKICLQNIENNEKSTVEKLVGEIEKKLINLEPEELNLGKADYDLEIKLETQKYEEKNVEEFKFETLNIKKEVSDLTCEEEKGISQSSIEEETITTNKSISIIGSIPTIESIPEESITNEKVIGEEIIDETTIDEKILDKTIIDEKVIEESITEESITNEKVFDEAIINDKVIDEKVIDEKVINEKLTNEKTMSTGNKEDNKIEVNEPVDEIDDRVINKKKYFINDEQPFSKPVIFADENSFSKAQKDATEAILTHKEKMSIFGQICDFFTSGMCCSAPEENTAEVNPAIYTMIDYLESNHYNNPNLFKSRCTDENYKEIVRDLTNGENVEFWNYNPHEIVAALKMYVGKEINGFLNTEYSEIILKVLLNKGEEGELIIKQNGKLVMA
ncbi:hypothetical protein DMUE_2552 [Dictyocoela muelleri]|nr:hypothetical protein DMUE_2552 [Dictyocoela muelleri]